MTLKFKGLIKGEGEPRIKIEKGEIYIVTPEGARVKQYFLGGVIYYCIEHYEDKWYFKVRLSDSALGDWVEPLKPSEWVSLEKLMKTR
ncbi:MAG: hypothetical protein ACXQTI_00670 [Candidatus Nezhaarchaeales archaeon]